MVDSKPRGKWRWWPANLGRLLKALLLAYAVAVLANFGWTVLAIGLAVLAAAWRATNGNLRTALRTSSNTWLSGASIALIVAHTPGGLSLLVGHWPPNGLDILVVFWGWWLYWLGAESKYRLWAAAVVNQFLSTAAIFLAAAFGGWASAWVILAIWLSSWLVGQNLLGQEAERAGKSLALIWALVASEVAWILNVWQVYHVQVWLGGLIIPQAAVVLSVLGYCFGGIYLAHKNAKLNRGRLVEYLAIGLLLIVTVIAGTEWNKII